MRKGRGGGKREKKWEKKTGEKKEKRRMKIVATTSLPAVDRPNADRWNAARSRQLWRLPLSLVYISSLSMVGFRYPIQS